MRPAPNSAPQPVTDRRRGIVSGRGTRDYCFIDYMEGIEAGSVFAHCRDFPAAKVLPKGTVVDFELVRDSHGRLMARAVWPIEPGTEARR
jgi:hypothetical protein